MKKEEPFRVVITGPESTGKTTLSRQLSEHFGGVCIAEYAREYVEKLTRPYTYNDIENIARRQLEQYRETEKATASMFFFDTWLIITKVWFEWSYGRFPRWIESAITGHPVDLFLLCRPDLMWEADPVRENGGENRLKLFQLYREELEFYGFDFVEIGGEGDIRLQNAVSAVCKFSGLE